MRGAACTYKEGRNMITTFGSQRRISSLLLCFLMKSPSFICAVIIQQSAQMVNAEWEGQANNLNQGQNQAKAAAGLRGTHASMSSSWTRGFPCLLILLQMSVELRRIKLQLLHIHFRISCSLTGSERVTELASLPQEFRSECNRARQKWSLLNHRSRKTDGFLSMADFSLPSRGHLLECMDRLIITIPTWFHTTFVILN